jgi:hypothetical protein
MHSPIAATALLEPIPRRPIHPKAAARFPAAFRILFRFPTRTVRKPQAVVALATIEGSRTTNELRRRRRAALSSSSIARPTSILLERTPDAQLASGDVACSAPRRGVAWMLLLLAGLAAPDEAPLAGGVGSHDQPTRTAKERLGVSSGRGRGPRQRQLFESHLLGLPVPQKLLAVNWQRSVG